MFCWSEKSCSIRMAGHSYWMSSLSWAPTMVQGGIFATDGSSAWGNANRIFVKCAPPVSLRALSTLL